jgi:cyanophycin synthetase
MAQVKAIVPETVFPHGYAILNAEDDRVFAMRETLKCNIALFSMDENNPRIKKHCTKGGIASVYENGYVTIMKGTWKIRIEKVTEIPLTFGGKAIHNIMNVLPAILACYLFKNIKVEDIRNGLHSFIPSASQTPGRLNLFDFKNFKFLVDFAHNPAGLTLLADFVNRLDSTYKMAIITGTGDRRDEDIRDLGRISGKNFDEIIIRQDVDLRGRTGEEITNLLIEGINETKEKEIPLTIIPDEKEAILYAYKNAKPGSIVTVMCDSVSGTIEFVKSLKEDEEKRFSR